MNNSAKFLTILIVSFFFLCFREGTNDGLDY